MPLLAQASLNAGCSTPYAACAGYSGGRRTGLPRQTVMKSWQVRAGYRGGRPEWCITFEWEDGEALRVDLEQ